MEVTIGDRAESLVDRLAEVAIKDGQFDRQRAMSAVTVALAQVAEAGRADAAPGVDGGSSYAHRSRFRSAFHSWINRRQDERRKAGEPWEQHLYEWMSAIEEMGRLPIWMRRLREGKLPTVHQQCSQAAPEPIAENHLVCALGQDVGTCPIVQSVYAHVSSGMASDERMHARLTEKYPDRYPKAAYKSGPPDDVLSEADGDRLAGIVCAWHIFTTVYGVGERKTHHDTSEGFVQDQSDRMYWRTVYSHLAAADRS